MKDFNESWNKAKHKIGAVEPNGYTRIGPALRHAGARMDQLDAKTNGLSCFPMENQTITINTKDNTVFKTLNKRYEN